MNNLDNPDMAEAASTKTVQAQTLFQLEDVLRGTAASNIIVDNHTFSIRHKEDYGTVLEYSNKYFTKYISIVNNADCIEGIYNLISDISTRVKRTETKKNSNDGNLLNIALVRFGEEQYENTADYLLKLLPGANNKEYSFETGNLIGYITNKNGYSLKIGSRFGDLFLKYIIAEADGFNELPDSGSAGNSTCGYDWLLHYYWTIKLKTAYRLGLPKEYVSRREPLTKVRGSIDPVDYVRHGELGRYLCTYREHSYDNPAVALFAETYRRVRSGGTGFAASLHSVYLAFLNATNGIRRPRRELMQTKHFRNPYYNDYNVVIDVSKQILRGQSFDFAPDSNWSGFLFDVSMLFEYFIRKHLYRSIPGLRMAGKNSDGKTIPTGTKKRRLIPDLVFDYDGQLYVFDVKYKYFDRIDGVSREDLFQLHTYIGQWSNEKSVSGCGFIYPIKSQQLKDFIKNEKKEIINYDNLNNDIPSEDHIIYKDVITQQGSSVSFFILFLTVPQNTLYTDEAQFYGQMTANCDFFRQIIEQYVLKHGNMDNGMHRLGCREI